MFGKIDNLDKFVICINKTHEICPGEKWAKCHIEIGEIKELESVECCTRCGKQYYKFLDEVPDDFPFGMCKCQSYLGKGEEYYFCKDHFVKLKVPSLPRKKKQEQKSLIKETKILIKSMSEVIRARERVEKNLANMEVEIKTLKKELARYNGSRGGNDTFEKLINAAEKNLEGLHETKVELENLIKTLSQEKEELLGSLRERIQFLMKIAVQEECKEIFSSATVRMNTSIEAVEKDVSQVLKSISKIKK